MKISKFHGQADVAIAEGITIEATVLNTFNRAVARYEHGKLFICYSGEELWETTILSQLYDERQQHFDRLF
jgi:hypothetical protein